MSDWPPIETLLVPVEKLTAFSMCSCGPLPHGTVANAVWPAANLAIYIPFRVSAPVLVTQMFTTNGSTVAGNVDIGIYDVAGTRLVSSGATAQSGTSALQAYDITDTLLAPGQFYLACSLSDGTATIARVATSAQFLRAFGCAQEASAHPLPATATFATMAQAYLPIIGLTTESVV